MPRGLKRKRKQESMARGEIFPEEIRKARAVSLDIMLAFQKKSSKVSMGWYLRGMPVLIYYTEDDACVAKCLPFNQLGLGNNPKTAIENLTSALDEIVRDAIENGYIDDLMKDLSEGVGCPSDIYWEKYNEAVKTQAPVRLPKQFEIRRATVEPRAPVDLGTPGSMCGQLAHA